MSPDAKRSQLDADAADSMTKSKCNSPVGIPDNSVKGDKKKRSFIPRIFGYKRSGEGSSDGDLYRPDEADGLSLDMFTSRRQAFMEASPVMRKSFSERQTNPRIEGLNLSGFELSMAPAMEKKEISMFVSTWNAGGRTPDNSLDLEDFLQVEDCSDVYVLGFQEVVPLNAGNVLVVEDNEPAAKWLILINQALNRPNHRHDSDSSHGGSTSSTYSSSKDLKTPTSHNFFHKPSLKVLSRNFRADNSCLKSCNCPLDDSHERDKQRPRKITDPSHQSEATSFRGRRDSAEELLGAYMDLPDSPLSPTGTDGLCYGLIASKQMVGIFLTVWARSELVQYIGHLRVSSVGRGIMGRLGNKGCISVSMTLHETSFCFVCSHLASGEKEGDELKRNSDVIEILKNTQFSKICKNSCRLEPQKIMDHDRIIWMGDLNYRLSMSYEDTRSLLENNDWDTLLEKDQLNMERQAGRIFAGFCEGKIHFAPTYKYSQNSDSYAGETVKSKKKRRTPAWCDRILWRGQGIEQLSYDRGESRFSDHRPVSSMFTVNVEVISKKMKFRKGFSCAATRLEFLDYIPQRHSFYEY